MDRPGIERKLTAILAADVVGYSRLMHADDQATLQALTDSRELFSGRVAEHGGRIVNAPGDSILAEFPSVVKTVECALEIQRTIADRNAPLPEERRMQFRIGVNLGDVLVDSAGVYGDGVNVAARLESLCEPGGVAVSASAYEQVRDRLDYPFIDAGEHVVKNIARPVHVYRLDLSAYIAGAAAPKASRSLRQRKLRLPLVLALAGVLAVVVAGILVASPELAEKTRRSAMALLRGQSLDPATRASIAVMPFANQSGDAKRDYFSDGITEDIINALGRFSGLMVISRNAVQAYKGRPISSAEISRELGVRYIAQGSVREADGKLRVVVELSDAEKGAQLWSERYDGAGAEVFEIQDRIVKNIVGALAVKLTRIEQQRVFNKPTDSLEAYDLVLRARSLLDLSERSANREARALLARAQKLSPEYAEIFTAFCDAEFQRAVYGWIEDASQAMRRAEELCKRALASVDQHAHTRAHALIAAIYGHQDRYEEALSHTERAIALNASDSTVLYRHGATLLSVGRIDEAIAAMETAKRFEPHPSAGTGLNLAIAYYFAERYREALAQADALLARTPHHVALNAIRAAALAQLGNTDEGRRAADQVRRFSPWFDVENFGTRFANPAYTARLHDGLRKAGL